MLRMPEAVRESMERAREFRGVRAAAWIVVRARNETREIVRALRAARRTEGALIARWGVAE